MCGIVGAIGEPKNPVTSYNLLTQLFRETQRRGPHAAGYFRVGPDKNVDWEKAPGTSRKFVQTDSWKRTVNGGPGIIMHCRYTTHGSATVNENNHPFVSDRGNWALVHNGIVFGYNEIKSGYTLQTECDSELILRIIAGEKDIIRGIKRVFELLGPGGDFACEVLHTNPKNGETTLYFFRETGRPGVFVDAREKTGQYFFVSEEAIWKDAVKHVGLTKELGKCKTVTVPPYQIWKIRASEMDKIVKIVLPVPAKKSRTTTTTTGRTTYYGGAYGSGYTSGYTAGGGAYGGGSYGGSYVAPAARGTGYSAALTQQQPPPVTTSKPMNHKPTKSVLGPEWTEEYDKVTGLPTFIFDPSRKKADPVKVEVKSEAKVVQVEAAKDPDEDVRMEYARRAIRDPKDRYRGWEDDVVELGLMTMEDLINLLAAEEETMTQQSDDEAIANLQQQLEHEQ